MSKLEDSLNKIAENIRHLDEASLMALWETYKTKMEKFSRTPEWEKSVIIFAIINAVRVKNAIFNEEMLKAQKKGGAPSAPDKPDKPHKPPLRLVK